MNEIFSVEIKHFKKFKDGRMFSYAYSIKKDVDGNEVFRTEPMLLSSIGYDDRRTFTEKEYKRMLKKIRRGRE